MKFVAFLCLLIIGIASEVRGELDTSELSNRLNSLGIDPEQGGQAAEKVFEDHCRKYGGEDAVERGKNAQQEVIKCVQNLLNMTEIQREVEEAKPNGELDTVFKKYCAKSPQLLDCATNLTKSIEPCLADDQKKFTDIVQNVSKTLLNFTCFKEGDRIALFIAEGGPECLESKQNDVQICLNETFGKYAENVPTSVNITDLNTLNFPMFLFDEGQCSDIDTAMKCIVDRLVTCKDPTPANVVESIFGVIRKVIPCKQRHGDGSDVKSAGLGAATSLYISIPSLLLALLLSRI